MAETSPGSARFDAPNLRRTRRSSARMRLVVGCTVMTAGAVGATALLAPTATYAAKPKRVSKTTAKVPATATTAATATSVPAKVNGGCRAIRIMPLGDSLTAFAESYRGPLFRDLVASGRKVDFVGSVSWPPTGGGDADGEGHGGYTIGPNTVMDGNQKADLADNIDRWIPAAKPDVILLTIGTNDIAGGGDLAANAPAKLTALITRITALAPQAVLAVGDIPPSIYDRTSTNINKATNDAGRVAANASTTDRIIAADTAARLLAAGFNPDKDTSDGAHFTVDGGVKFAKAWRPAVDEALAMTKIC